jgi:hypothetical protein
VAVKDAAAGAAESSERDGTRIPTPDSSSQGSIWAFGRKCGPLTRICSGSQDRLVLGHLCTDRPENTCNRVARAHGRSIGHGGWAAGHAEWTWGTAAKQQHVSHAHLGRAAASQKALLHAVDKAAWRSLNASTAAAEETASAALDMCCAVRIWAALPCTRWLWSEIPCRRRGQPNQHIFSKRWHTLQQRYRGMNTHIW